MIAPDVKAVLFDMDETLIENTRSFQDIARDLFGSFEDALAPVCFDDFWPVFWGRAVDMWNMMIDGALPGDVARSYVFINTLRALGADPSLAGAMLLKTDELQLAATRMPDDTLPVLQRLRHAGLRLGIVTNGFKATQWMKVSHYKLDEYVDFVLVSEEAGAHKPDRRIFELALWRAEVEATQALFVGDTPENDIEGAKGAGIPGVLIDFHGRFAHDAVPAIGRIRRLSELLAPGKRENR